MSQKNYNHNKIKYVIQQTHSKGFFNSTGQLESLEYQQIRNKLLLTPFNTWNASLHWRTHHFWTISYPQCSHKYEELELRKQQDNHSFLRSIKAYAMISIRIGYMQVGDTTLSGTGVKQLHPKNILRIVNRNPAYQHSTKTESSDSHVVPSE